MADFKTHTSVGLLLGLVLATGGWLLGFIGLLQGFAALVLTIIGAGLPDIDCENARPRTILLGILGIAVPVILWQHVSSGKSTNEELFCFMILSYVIVQHGLSWFFGRYTVHRGAFHSIPSAIICAALSYILFTGSTHPAQLTFALACAAGYLSHLALDEVYSIDIFGVSTRRSFGTALKWRLASRSQTALAYLAIILLAVVCFFV